MILLIALGGMCGVLSRYFSELFLKKHFLLPYPFLTINVVGCAIAGSVFYFIQKNNLNPQFYGFIVIGFLGGFTTFSSYGLDLLKLSLQGEGYLKLTAYAVASPALSLLACVAGYHLTKVALR